MKKKSKIVFVVIFSLIITGVFIIKTLTETSGGKINTYVAINLELDKILNPQSANDESIEKIRARLNRDATKSSKEPIPFSNIKNITIDSNSEKIPVRIYTPED